ncbi:caprin-2 isoform X2 [Syngnathoides biaculeatus]|uniref:caprin-2 isoform X2 n=1 Tax=Syngnathoides biaculeatus TaxID=300417 RepID=UPI002ADDEA00|nr:caprin-2 isoform X2 [Syngnathoides biaculeatus]
MVQLSPSPTTGVTLEQSADGAVVVASPKGDSPASPDAPPSFESPTAYYGYEAYVEDGLICLKHKVRNLEKKKLKLEHYKRRLDSGETLNKDQMAATDKYEQVVHNLEFAQELHKTMDNLTQNLLKSQKKAVKREQLVTLEAERRRLCTVLQVQHLLASIQHANVKRDLLNGRNQAPFLPPQRLNSLSQLATLLGVRQDDRMSLEQQMEDAALIYFDLLEGKEKPVAGSTFKKLKEELTKLLNCKYFSCLPSKTAPPVSKLTEPEVSEERKIKEEVTRSEEPPDCWDLEFSDEGISLKAPVHKPWKGAATLIPKAPDTSKGKAATSAQGKEKKAKREQNAKMDVHQGLPGMNLDLPTFPKDPILRKKHLEDLMTKIHGSFSFMQDSLLDCDSPPENGQSSFKREPPSDSSSPLAFKKSSEVVPKEMHSTPLPARLLDPKISLTNGDQSLKTFGKEISSNDPLHLAEQKKFSPPLFCTPESPIAVNLKSTLVADTPKIPPCNGIVPSISVTPPPHTFSTPPGRQTVNSVQFQNSPSVFNGGVKVEIRHANSSTQTPPEFLPSEDYSQAMGGTCVFQTHSKNYGHLLSAPKDSGSQNLCGCGAQHHFNAWRACSQVSSPDRAEEYTMVDSGHGDSLPASVVDVPHSPHGHHHASLLPVQLYPLSQPVRVAFTASRTVNFAPGNLDQPIVFDQLHSNLGEMFDTHIGRFTCPVNGMYVFMFHILKLAINVPLYINLMCNEEVMVSAYANDGAPDHETASNHAILPLFQGDQVWLRLHRGAIYGSTWKYSTFSGFLLYQD